MATQSVLFRRLLSSDWKIQRVNHIALATANADSYLSFFANALGLAVTSRKAQPEHGVSTTFVSFPSNGTVIEVLEPIGSKSPISNFLKRSPQGGIHHFCYEVDNLLPLLGHLDALGIKPIDPVPKIGAHGNPVVFLHPKFCNGMLVELEEVKPKC